MFSPLHSLSCPLFIVTWIVPQVGGCNPSLPAEQLYGTPWAELHSLGNTSALTNPGTPVEDIWGQGSHCIFPLMPMCWKTHGSQFCLQQLATSPQKLIMWLLMQGTVASVTLCSFPPPTTEISNFWFCLVSLLLLCLDRLNNVREKQVTYLDCSPCGQKKIRSRDKGKGKSLWGWIPENLKDQDSTSFKNVRIQ